MAFTRVQTAENNGGSGTALAATFAGAVGSGNTVLGVFSFDHGSGASVSSIADDKGNNYTIKTQLAPDTNGQVTLSFFLGNITNGPTVITLTLSAASSFRTIIVDEFSGALAAADPTDGGTGQNQAAPTTGADATTSTTITPSTNNDLIWGASVNSGGTQIPTNGTGFASSNTSTAQNGTRTEYLTQGTAAAIAATFTAAVNLPHQTLVVAVKPSAAVANPFYKQWDRPGFDLPGITPQHYVRSPSQFPNPIPFKEQIHRHTNGVMLSVPRDYARDPSRFPNPIPFSQTDWPRVQPTKLYVPDVVHPDINIFTNPFPFLQSWVPVKQPTPSLPQAILNNTVLTAVVTAPFAQLSWPTVTQPPSISQAVPYNLNIATITPFAQYSWVGPSKPRITLTDASDASEMWLFPPLTPSDFSKQFYPTTLPSGIQQTNINLFTNPVPFSTQWVPGTTVQGRASDVVQPWQNFYTVIVGNPFVQTSWPTTQSVKISPPQATPFNGNLFTNPFPFVQTDWSTTKFQTPRAPDGSQSTGVNLLPDPSLYMLVDMSGGSSTIKGNRFDQPYNQSLYGVVVQSAPFTPIDFSRPFVIPPSKVDVQSVNANLYTNPIPFGPYDWNTSSFFFASRGKAVPQDLPNLLLIQPSTPSNPLGIFSWLDLYKYVTLYPTTPAVLQNLTLILPTPIPPPDTIVGGTSRRWIDGYNELLNSRQTQREDIRKAAAVLSSMGGHARAESLTSKQRSNIASKAAVARWNPPIKR